MKLTNELKPYVRDQKGRWAKKTRWDFVTFGIITILIGGAYIGHVNAKGSDILIRSDATESGRAQDVGTACIKTPDGSCSFATKEMLAKWKVYLESEVEKLNYELSKKKSFQASVTKYSRKDSCHNPRGSECLTAIGRDTKAGVTTACPRTIKLGTRVRINGKDFVCEDRTAKWVEDKFGPTFDIFTEDQKEAIVFGRQKLEVTILSS